MISIFITRKHKHKKSNISFISVESTIKLKTTKPDKADTQKICTKLFLYLSGLK